jgi:hypothetical protein
MSLKKTMISFLAVCVGVSTSLASSNSTKVKNFQSIGDGVILNPKADGMAMITPQGSGSFLHLRMDDLERNRLYGVAVADATVDPMTPLFVSGAPFSTNSHGDGTYEASLPNPGVNPIVYVFDWIVSGTTLSPDSVRAYGMVGRATTPTVKIKDFDPIDAGLGENANVDGMAVVKFDPLTQSSEVHMHVRGLAHDQWYGVAFQGTCSGSPDFAVPLAFQTDSCGAGIFEWTPPLPTDLNDPGCPLPNGIVIYIYVWDQTSTSLDPDGSLVLPYELRAVATVDEEDRCHH